ncbi:MAG: serine hydrolase [bacterium]|nr:serine hydrolase [bacterium]
MGVLDSAERLGFDPDRLAIAEDVLTTHVQDGTMPGAVGLVLRRDGTVAQWAAGCHTYAMGAPAVRADHLFDLASVTKVVATVTLCMVFEAAGRLDLEAPVVEHVPAFVGPGKAGVTAQHLLAHCSGLPAHVHLYKEYGSREAILEAVCRLDLESEPGTHTVYSDMGFLVLGMLLESVGGDRLDRLAGHWVLDRLGMANTMFCPGASLKDRIVPTEHDHVWRGRLVHGEVHDENAACMGGVASHAGLFAPAADLGRFLQVWLGEGTLDGHPIFPAKSVRKFIERVPLVPGSTWALGWDTVLSGGSTTGRYFSERSFGSLGFTGTSVWADPERDLGVVLLTNRVHPTRDNWGIRKLRPAFHDAISEALGE